MLSIKFLRVQFIRVALVIFCKLKQNRGFFAIVRQYLQFLKSFFQTSDLYYSFNLKAQWKIERESESMGRKGEKKKEELHLVLISKRKRYVKICLFT